MSVASQHNFKWETIMEHIVEIVREASGLTTRQLEEVLETAKDLKEKESEKEK